MSADQLSYRRVRANGLDFRVAVAGEPDADRLVLCLHGFPELGFSWRHQLPALADAGYRVWAPDLRGYGGTTPRPPKVADYAMDHLVGDVAALIDESGADEVVLLAHDWGGAVAWEFAIRQIRPLTKLIVCNLPHPACMRRELKSFRQLRKSWYVFFFQLPWLPEKTLLRKNAEPVGEAFRAMSTRPEQFTDEVLDVYREAAHAPGAMKAMINWYRAALRGGRASRNREFPVLDTPTLMVWGEQDTALGIDTTTGTDEYVSDLTLRYLPDASHWVQQDQPDAVNAMITAFLAGEPVPEATDLP